MKVVVRFKWNKMKWNEIKRKEKKRKEKKRKEDKISMRLSWQPQLETEPVGNDVIYFSFWGFFLFVFFVLFCLFIYFFLLLLLPSFTVKHRGKIFGCQHRWLWSVVVVARLPCVVAMETGIAVAVETADETGLISQPLVSSWDRELSYAELAPHRYHYPFQ